VPVETDATQIGQRAAAGAIVMHPSVGGTAMSANGERLECLVIGGGPAGLTAATYLARFRRHIALLDGGESRARYIPVSHNCPGFPFGVSGTDLLDRMREQAAHFGIEPVSVRIDTLETHDGGFVASGGGSIWYARTVLLATGIRDRLPRIADLEQGIADGVVRICAICDGYEAADDRIAVLGPADDVVGHACFLRTFSRQVTVVLSEAGEVSADDRERATELGIGILPPSTSRRSCRSI
jgi:thioredoxin reductase (NADPH)